VAQIRPSREEQDIASAESPTFVDAVLEVHNGQSQDSIRGQNRSLIVTSFRISAHSIILGDAGIEKEELVFTEDVPLRHSHTRGHLQLSPKAEVVVRGLSHGMIHELRVSSVAASGRASDSVCIRILAVLPEPRRPPPPAPDTAQTDQTQPPGSSEAAVLASSATEAEDAPSHLSLPADVPASEPCVDTSAGVDTTEEIHPEDDMRAFLSMPMEDAALPMPIEAVSAVEVEAQPAEVAAPSTDVQDATADASHTQESDAEPEQPPAYSSCGLLEDGEDQQEASGHSLCAPLDEAPNDSKTLGSVSPDEFHDIEEAVTEEVVEQKGLDHSPQAVEPEAAQTAEAMKDDIQVLEDASPVPQAGTAADSAECTSSSLAGGNTPTANSTEPQEPPAELSSEEALTAAVPVESAEVQAATEPAAAEEAEESAPLDTSTAAPPEELSARIDKVEVSQSAASESTTAVVDSSRTAYPPQLGSDEGSPRSPAVSAPSREVSTASTFSAFNRLPMREGYIDLLGFHVRAAQVPQDWKVESVEQVILEVQQVCGQVVPLTLQQALRLALASDLDMKVAMEKYTRICTWRKENNMSEERSLASAKLTGNAQHSNPSVEFANQIEVYSKLMAVSPCVFVTDENEPISVWHFGTANTSTASSVPVERVSAWSRSFFEYIDLWLSMCSESSMTLLGHVHVFDLAGVGFSHMSSSSLKEKLVQAMGVGEYYVEIVNHIYVINAGTVFSMAWKAVKRLVPERTSAKITVTKGVPQELKALLPANSAARLAEVLERRGNAVVQRPH